MKINTRLIAEEIGMIQDAKRLRTVWTPEMAHAILQDMPKKPIKKQSASNPALIKQCSKNVEIAKKALIVAGDKLLKAMRATDDEIGKAAQDIRESMFDGLDADDIAGPYWSAYLAEIIFEHRENDNEDDNEETENY